MLPRFAPSRAARPTRRARRVAFGAAGAAALAVSTGLVWHTAYASFTTSTAPIATGFSTGTVTIGDDDAGVALFSTAGLEPGAAATRCLTVTSTGTDPAIVRLYGTGRSSTNALSSYLNLSIQAGTGGSSTTCSGFTPVSTVYTGALAAFPTTYGTGVDGWATTGTANESRTYQITYSIPSTAPASTQSGTASVAFTWEAQNS